MSNCAVCVYDLYDEARQDYVQALDKLRLNLEKKGVPIHYRSAEQGLKLAQRAKNDPKFVPRHEDLISPLYFLEKSRGRWDSWTRDLEYWLAFPCVTVSLAIRDYI